MPTQPAGPAPFSERQRISLPPILPPQGGGAVRGLGESFAAQTFTGEAGFSLAIPSPSARGVSPNLILSYSSGAGNGVFGLGAQVSVASISRKTSNGIPRYDERDTFVHSDQGDLVPALTWDREAGKWVPRVRTEAAGQLTYTVQSFRVRLQAPVSSIERWTCDDTGEAHWRLLTPENALQTFGTTDASRIADPAYPNRVFQWGLDEFQDATGNRIVYTYRPEDGTGHSGTARDHTANRYLAQVEYGNYLAGTDEHFAFRIVFDYGEFSSNLLEGPVGAWPVRPDPFSSYRSGFEVRTLRRCANILIYHCFHDRFAGEPILTKSLAITYQQGFSRSAAAPLFSMISSVAETGWRTEPDGSCHSLSSPPVQFSYTPFDPLAQSYQQLDTEGGILGGYLDGSTFTWADLDGEGIAGLLYSQPPATLFWEPLGEAVYAGPSAPAGFPSDSDLGEGGLSLVSLDANGELDLVLQSPARSGFYPCEGEGSWGAFRPFASAPLETGAPAATLVDLSGSGRADLALFDNAVLRSYPSLGTVGFGAPELAGVRPGFPAYGNPGLQELLTFADLFGDGLSHRVRIRDGIVECWPSLGYGNFGAPVLFENAPVFGESFDARNLFLADLAGSGMAGMVYAAPGQLRIYLNQNGNGFSDPLLLTLPVPYSTPGQISFADVKGNGTSCLIVSSLDPVVTHWVYDFSGDVKPWLLSGIDNNMGLETRIAYSTSVKSYLADKRSGRDWATRMYFPVQVVDRVETIDAISHTRTVTRHRYHDGYFDPVERQFRGFGFVETWDAEQTDTLALASGAVAPTYARTWFELGACGSRGRVAQQYRKEYWHGDPLAAPDLDPVFDPSLDWQDAETVRQAYVALAGTMLRQEIYGLDGSARQADPFTVLSLTPLVRQVQPRAQQAYAVFFVATEQSLAYQYDRNPADPRMQHDFNLEIDGFGNVTRSCTVAYARRQGTSAAASPEQLAMRVTCSKNAYINHPATVAEPFHWIAASAEVQTFELDGLTASAYFSFSGLAQQVAEAFDHPIDYGVPFTPGLRQARLFQWERSYFWDAALAEALPLGSLSACGLGHHQEQAVMTPLLVQQAFDTRLTAQRIAADAGYWLHEGYWWNRGTIVHFQSGPGQFFLPARTSADFSDVDAAGPFNPVSTLSYDDYALLSVGSVRYVQGTPGASTPAPVTLTVSAQNDYQALGPWQITDPNGNFAEALYDPMGRVIVTTSYGTQQGQPVGDAPLSDYIPVASPTFAEVLSDPLTYLQNASSFFFYDMLAWRDRSQPTSSVALQRQTSMHALTPGETSLIDTLVSYSDGFARIVEQRRESTPGPLLARDTQGMVASDGGVGIVTESERWIVSGRTVYNNKALPLRQYQPFYSPGPGYESLAQATQTELVPTPTTYTYDAINRLIRTDTPKGFFSKVEFSPWEMKKFDLDDTVKDSAYYKNFPPPTTPEKRNEQEALEKAAVFFNTPEIEVLDPLGRTVRVLQNNLGAVAVAALEPVVEGSPITTQQLFDSLLAHDYLRADSQGASVAWLTEAVQPYSPIFQGEVQQQFPLFPAALLDFFKSNGLTTLRELDIAGQEIALIDPRLLYTNVTQGTSYRNLTRLLDMAGLPLVSDSCDAGLTRSLHNIFGDLWWNLSPRNFEQTILYDRLQRRTTVSVLGLSSLGDVVTTTLAEVFTYGETQPESQASNLRGQLYQACDQSGTVTHSLYDQRGAALRTTRQFTSDYKNPIDWAATVPLQTATYLCAFTYNELGQQVTETLPDLSVIRTDYDQAGRVASMTVGLADGSAQTVLESVAYNAHGDRTSIVRGNGASSVLTYEPTTLRLQHLSTTRPATNRTRGTLDTVLQDIAYTYDPVGNVTRVFDATYEAVFSKNQKVEPLSGYTCDALYRLIRAEGRQNSGVDAATWRNNIADGDFKQSRFFLLPNDGEALETFQEQYTLDDAGNLTGVSHQATHSWSRRQEVLPGSNRLKTVSATNGVVYSSSISYDNAGNQRQLDINSPVNLTWNCCDNLVSARVIQRPDEPDDTDYYNYASDERRTRKVSERLIGGTTTETVTRLYVGSYEVKLIERSSAAGTGTILLERQDLRVTDQGDCIAILSSWAQDKFGREVPRAGARSTRYQFGNLLGSVSLELNSTAEIVSYEEYFPFGGTAYLAGANASEVSRKDYRYMGKECDDSTGLYYFGGRYYATWLGRWLKPDPRGAADGLNLYAFVAGNPLRYDDPSGYTKKSVVASRYFIFDGIKASGIKKKRPTNQSSAKTQKKIATRLSRSKAKLPQHMQAFIDEVDTNGKADLTGLGQDICHVTAVDKMKEATAEAISQRGKLTNMQKRKYADAIVETVSSDEDSDREEIREQAELLLDPNTSAQETVELGDKILSRVNRASPNLRSDYNRTNRGIGNSKDPFIINEQEESRSKGVSDGWNDIRQELGLKRDEPKSKKFKGDTLYKSSSVDPTPKNAFTKITGTFTL